VELRPDPEGFDRLFVSAPELDAEFEVFFTQSSSSRQAVPAELPGAVGDRRHRHAQIAKDT
jgi:hypothetical protein